MYRRLSSASRADAAPVGLLIAEARFDQLDPTFALTGGK
jgi:hypothetical protein